MERNRKKFFSLTKREENPHYLIFNSSFHSESIPSKLSRIFSKHSTQAQLFQGFAAALIEGNDKHKSKRIAVPEKDLLQIDSRYLIDLKRR